MKRIRIDRLHPGRRHLGYFRYIYDGPWIHHFGFWFFGVSWGFGNIELFL